MRVAKAESDRAAEVQTMPATRIDKTPRSARGRKTLRALLDAASEEFGENGFHEGAISRITARAGVAIGSFYTYFDSKEEIFTALVRDLSQQVRDYVTPRVVGQSDPISAERAAQAAFLEFAQLHKELYRVIDEAEFVDPASYREHYQSTASRMAGRLEAARAAGDVSDGTSEIRAWAIMGMNVFLGLRYGVWGGDVPVEEVARVAGDLIANGLAPRDDGEKQQ